METMKQSGQAVLMVLLVVAIALGLGLSLIAQSTTDLRITQQEQESARVFNAAEAGIENALRQISTVELDTPMNFDVDDIPVSYVVSGQNFVEGQVAENDSAQVQLAAGNNNLVIEWVDEDNASENPGNCSGVTAVSGGTAASLLITVVTNTYQVSRYGINACALNSVNNLTDVLGAAPGQYLRRYNLTAAGPGMVRIRPVYNTASIRVSATTSLPPQAYVINSSARADNTNESREIEVTRYEPAAPAVFDYVVFSGGDLIK